MDKKKSKCVFFLGAGFSANAGIPTQKHLLPEYLKKGGKKQIFDFLSDVYSFDCHPNSDINIYPKLEEIFSTIDTAIINNEYLKTYSPDTLHDTLGEVRENLVLGILDLIDKSKKNSDYIDNFAKVLTNFRFNSENDDPFAIITTNWDIVLLNAFRKYHNELIKNLFGSNNAQNLMGIKEDDRKKIALLDYCLYTHPLRVRDKKNHIPSLKIKAMGYKNIKLLYLHGSPTWLYCKKCKKIYSDPSYNKEYDKKALNYNVKRCPQCKVKTLSPILIMPTYYKIIQNVHLLDVWQNAAMELQEATTVFFIGYSLPEADYLIRNLLVSNINDGANIYISSRSGSDSDTKKKNCPETVNNYRQLFGRRIKDDNIRKGTGKEVIMDICKKIKDGNFEGF